MKKFQNECLRSRTACLPSNRNIQLWLQFTQKKSNTVGQLILWKFIVKRIPKLPNKSIDVGEMHCASRKRMGIWTLKKGSTNCGHGWRCMNPNIFGWPRNVGFEGCSPDSIGWGAYKSKNPFWNSGNKTCVIWRCVTTCTFIRLPMVDIFTWNNHLDRRWPNNPNYMT